MNQEQFPVNKPLATFSKDSYLRKEYLFPLAESQEFIKAI